MIVEINDLDRQGFTRERYAAIDKQFHDWNMGVWHHEWMIEKGPCALCQSVAPGILVKALLVCFPCLSSHPRVPWHPTGAIRPRVSVMLSHVSSCEQHLKT